MDGAAVNVFSDNPASAGWLRRYLYSFAWKETPTPGAVNVYHLGRSDEEFAGPADAVAAMVPYYWSKTAKLHRDAERWLLHCPDAGECLARTASDIYLVAKGQPTISRVVRDALCCELQNRRARIVQGSALGIGRGGVLLCTLNRQGKTAILLELLRTAKDTAIVSNDKVVLQPRASRLVAWPTGALLSATTIKGAPPLQRHLAAQAAWGYPQASRPPRLLDRADKSESFEVLMDEIAAAYGARLASCTDARLICFVDKLGGTDNTQPISRPHATELLSSMFFDYQDPQYPDVLKLRGGSRADYEAGCAEIAKTMCQRLDAVLISSRSDQVIARSIISALDEVERSSHPLLPQV
jgi:hypothetical protein